MKLMCVKFGGLQKPDMNCSDESVRDTGLVT